jgi:hypothetical protein
MACEYLKLDGGQTVIICGLRRSKPKRCSHAGCEATGTKLCDWPIGGGRTCSKPLCDRHAVRAGRDVDHCLHHEPKRQQELAL